MSYGYILLSIFAIWSLAVLTFSDFTDRWN